MFFQLGHYVSSDYVSPFGVALRCPIDVPAFECCRGFVISPLVSAQIAGLSLQSADAETEQVFVTVAWLSIWKFCSSGEKQARAKRRKGSVSSGHCDISIASGNECTSCDWSFAAEELLHLILELKGQVVFAALKL
ncbi:hypothetical protein KC19_5G130400 [Ceratodon purpureus]|uniref:Uncharacterized protein n=1 Tax=Ceratodon purpureus TaxID=3225 RepID=A0A8T0I2D6_CERPU|nr:hypothetical protein KC19_N026600 [Ceratodon purpureus]KAG0577095.1 hypothetical protein KC19_5G130400 [Ceratodon purpureus]